MKVKRNYDAGFFVYEKTKKPSDSGISFLHNKIFVADCYMENCGFWIHELTELSIIRVLNRLRIKRQKLICWKGYKPATIAHFISDFGLDNQRCLNPQKNRRIPEW